MENFINKILFESFDFQKIESIKHEPRRKSINDYTFEFFINNHIDVQVKYDFINMQSATNKHYFPNFPEDSIGYNLGYAVSGSDIQGAITNFKVFLQILKTILDDAVDFLNTINPDFLLVLTSPYDEKGVTKYAIYKKIINGFKNKIPSEYSIGTYDKDFNGFIVQKYIQNMTDDSNS